LESKGISFILIIVIAVLSLTLAALAGYLFIVQGASGNKTDAAAVAEGEAAKKITLKEDRIIIPLFEDKRTYNLKNEDPEKSSMMQLHVALDCYKQLKNDKKTDVEEKVLAYSDEIQEIIVKFFLTKTVSDVKDVAVMEKAKEELATEINKLLNEGVKKPEDVIYKVIFSEWIFV